MFDEKKQVLEIKNGFKNLSSKIRDENVKIKETLTKNETTISACKKEYQKLYQQYEKIQQENENLSNILLIYSNSYNSNNNLNFKHITIIKDISNN